MHSYQCYCVDHSGTILHSHLYVNINSLSLFVWFRMKIWNFNAILLSGLYFYILVLQSFGIGNIFFFSFCCYWVFFQRYFDQRIKWMFYVNSQKSCEITSYKLQHIILVWKVFRFFSFFFMHTLALPLLACSFSITFLASIQESSWAFDVPMNVCWMLVIYNVCQKKGFQRKSNRRKANFSVKWNLFITNSQCAKYC